jgi:hypothetical protein
MSLRVVTTENGDVKLQHLQVTSDGVPAWRDLVVTHNLVDYLVAKGAMVATRVMGKFLRTRKGA